MMPTQTQSTALPVPPTIPSGRAIYDWIMGQIEPELVSSSLPLLKTKYKDETEGEKETRKQRYNAAFAKYYEMYEVYLADLDARIHRYYREALRSIEERNNLQEKQTLDDISVALSELT